MPVAFAPGAPRRRRPVLRQARAARPAHARAPAGERQPRRRARAGCPTRARCPTARRRPPTRSRSPTSSTARATCCAAAPPRARPSSRPGQSLSFRNTDAARTIFHTITACRAPCNRSTGIAYPLADGPVDFDSGELGFGPAGFTPAANRDTWATPANLGAGHLHVLLPRAPVHARGVPGQRLRDERGRWGSPCRGAS